MASSISHPYPARSIKVIHLKGSPYKIGAQHASAVGDEVHQGMTAFYASFWRRMMQKKEGSFFERVGFQLGTKIIDPILVEQLKKALPSEAKDLIRGLCDESGAHYDELIKTSILPDLMPILLSISAQIRPRSVIPVSAFPVPAFPVMEPVTFGCSSFFSNRSGALLHGRNLDFPGVGFWDRYPVIQVNELRHKLKYLGFTTAGVPICGITGVNEAQISVSLHQHYGRVYSLKGTPPFVIAERILEKARSIEEALGILKQYRMSACWAFLIGDGKTKEAVICETHPTARGILRLIDHEGVMAHSNFFQTPECKPAGYATTGRMNWDNYWRKTRLENEVRRAGSTLTLEMAAQLMSEHVDGFLGFEKMINRTVSQVYNLQSVVMDLTHMRAWVAEGDCPIHLGKYSEYDLAEIFSGRSGRTGKTCLGYQFENENIKNAKRDFILSFVASFDGDDGLSLARVEKALGSHVSPEAAMVAGVLSLKCGNYARAQSHLENAVATIENGEPGEYREKGFPPEYFESMLFLGRCYDLRGHRNEALRCYKVVREHRDSADEHLKMLASDRHPYQAKKLSRVLTPYSSYIPFE